MSHKRMMQECDQEVCQLLPDLPRPEQKALAGLVCGVVAEGSAVLSRASAALPGRAQNRSKYRQAQRLLANPRFQATSVQHRLAARVLGQCSGRVDLLVDSTTTGATSTQGGTCTLCVALAWHGRAVPLLWRTWPTWEPGQDWSGALQEMFDVIESCLPKWVQVVLLADRGLTGNPLARAAQERGWHFLLRVQRTTCLRLPTRQVLALGDLVPQPGCQACLTAVQVWAEGHARRNQEGSWARALRANVVAVWRAAEEDAWLLVTDLPATLARCTEYRRRSWEEALFRDLKGWGWNWQQCRIRQAERVERWLVVLALATVWMLAVGQRVLRKGWRCSLEERSRRCYSHFQLGLRWVKRCLINDQPVPCLFHFWHEPRAPVKLS